MIIEFFFLSSVFRPQPYDSVTVDDLLIQRGRAHDVYPLHEWKAEQAYRLYTFMQNYNRFIVDQMRIWLYRELYLFRNYKFQSRFVRAVLRHIIDSLEFYGYIYREEADRIEYWRVLRRPTLEVCQSILQSQSIEILR